jgi:hypothetical protein
MKKRGFSFLFLLTSVLLTGASLTQMAQAVSRSVFLNQDICAPEKKICLRGSLYFDEDREQMAFSGRVIQSTQPGKLVIKIEGESDSGKTYKLKLSKTIEGRYSEIVDITEGFSKKSDMPQDIKWRIKEVIYKFSNG